MPSCFGGASDAQKSISGQQEDFANLALQNYRQRYADQTADLGKLGTLIQNVSNGKLAPGFDASTLAALNTSAINSTAANYRNAAQVTQNAFAGRGGNSGLETGIQAQVRAANANQAAGQLSTEQQKIQLANYDAARQNTNAAIAGYSTLAGLANPEGFGNLTGSAQGAAYKSASDINALENQKLSNELSFGTNLAMKAATFGMGGIGNLGPGESFGEGAGDFLSGGFKALSGNA